MNRASRITAALLLPAAALAGLAGCGRPAAQGSSTVSPPPTVVAATPDAGATGATSQDLASIDQQLSSVDRELGSADSGINSTEGDPTR